MRRRILITGASGRLGSAVVRLWRDTHDVIPFDLREPADPSDSFILGSISDPEAVTRAMADADTVVHCAAIPGTRKPYHSVIETNVMGTFHVLEAAGRNPRVERFIYISSVMYHGLSESPFTNRPLYLPIDEDHPSLAMDYYACSKAQAEYWCRAYVRRFNKPLVAIRPPWIIGMDMEATFAAQPAAGVPHLNDYIGVTDLAGAMACAIDYEPPDGFDVFLVHAEDQRSTTRSMELAERHFPGVPLDRAWLEASGGFGSFIRYTHAAERLGWRPQFHCMR
ncbi:MAG: NAD(P)-dependent oxidoreductase [Candidatus Hydrogenedentes bacterium]|nr:NAD(P)-dependent oxidoreductase [Candidatus Hydrogenedentota bacterium]